MSDIGPEKSRTFEPQKKAEGTAHVVTHLDITAQVRDQSMVDPREDSYKHATGKFGWLQGIC